MGGEVGLQFGFFSSAAAPGSWVSSGRTISCTWPGRAGASTYQKEWSETATKTTAFAYCRAPRRVRSKERMERGGLPRILRCVHFPPQHRRLPLPLLDRYRLHALAWQILAPLAEEADPSKKLALRLCWPYPLLGRDFHLVRREALVAGANSLSRSSPH